MEKKREQELSVLEVRLLRPTCSGRRTGKAAG